MDDKKKRLIFFLGAIFVAVIFLTSYAAFSNNNTSASSTTTSVKSSATYFSTGSTNAIILNYSDIALVTPANGSNATYTLLNKTLSDLESNGSIENYIYQNSSYQLILSSVSAYGLQSILNSKLGSNSSAYVGADAQVMLPKNVTLYYNGQGIPLQLTSRNYSVYLSKVKSIGTEVNVSISALLLNNGSVYNNQIRVTSSS